MSEISETTAGELLRLAPDAGRDESWHQPEVPERYRIHNRTFYFDPQPSDGQIIRVIASVGFLLGQDRGWRYTVGASVRRGDEFTAYNVVFGDVENETEALALAEEGAVAYLNHPVLPAPPAPIPNLDLVTQVHTDQTPMDFIKRRLPTVREFTENVHREDFVLDEGMRATLARIGDDMAYLIEQNEELLGWGTEAAHELELAQAELVRLNAELDAGNASDGHHTHNELYEQRMLYHAHLAQRWYTEGVPIVKSRRHHTGEECFDGDYFIVVTQLPTGQVSQHYPISAWPLFCVEAQDKAPVWDGHNAAEGNRRLREALRLMPPGHSTPQRRCPNAAGHEPHYFADSRVFWCATVPPTLEAP